MAENNSFENTLTICIPPLLGWKDPEQRDNAQINERSSSTSGEVVIRLLGDNCSTGVHLHRINCSTNSAVNHSIGTTYVALSGEFHHHHSLDGDDANNAEDINMNSVSNNSSLAGRTEFNYLTDNSGASKSNIVTDSNLPFRDKIPELNLPCGFDVTTLFGAEGTVSQINNPSTACALTSSPGYIIYSAFGSFWIPMLVMVFFYVKIYRTAVKATDALRRGVVTQRSSSSSDPSVNLRVHRGGGGGGGVYNRATSDTVSRGSNASMGGASWLNGGEVLPPPHFRLHQLVEQVSPRYCRPNSADTMISTDLSSDIRFYKRSLSNNDCENNRYIKRTSRELNERPTNDVTTKYYDSRSRSGGVMDWRSDTFDTVYEEEHYFSNGCSPPTSPILLENNGLTNGVNSAFNNNRRGLLHVRTQLRRLNREKKAAKTVGVIVGCFVLCWAPFFTVYLLGAFCVGCTPPVVFTIVFWLGYCNSAINPFIYAMCSNDFRRAFKKFLCCGHRRTRRTRLAMLISGLKSGPTTRRELNLISRLT